MGELARESTLVVRFVVTPSFLARSMALAAREALPDADDGNNFGTEDPRLAEYVQSMTKRNSLATLRADFRSYGDLSWPDDWPREAYRAGLGKAREWGYV